MLEMEVEKIDFLYIPKESGFKHNGFNIPRFGIVAKINNNELVYSSGFNACSKLRLYKKNDNGEFVDYWLDFSYLNQHQIDCLEFIEELNELTY